MRLSRSLTLSTLIFALAASAAAQGVTQLTASDAAAGDDFGEDVAISGDLAIVGAGDEDEGVGGAGSAYVFRRSAGVWGEEQKLTRPTPASNYHFGRSVAIDGDVAVCGVPDDDDFASRAGSVDVFRFDGATWVHEQRLTAGDQADGDRFGWSVDVAGAVIVVGAKFDDDVQSNSGSAYVFRYNGVNWLQEQKLTAFDAAQNAQFGDAIALDGGVVVVGAWQDDDAGFFTGGAYVFRHNGATWQSEQKLNASDQDEFHWFGRSVGVSGDLIVCGAYEADVGAFTSGAAYVYRHSAGTWTEEAKLSASDTDDTDNYGWSADVSGDLVVVGARRDTAPLVESGSVYVYQDAGGAWNEVAKVTASGVAGDQLGSSLAIDAGSVIAGAVQADTTAGANSGAAYAFPAQPGAGTQFCAGDGSGTPCPCANENDGSNGFAGCANGTHAGGASLSGTGSPSVSNDTVVLTASGLQAGQPGLFFRADNAINAGLGVIFGDGLRCAGGNLIRLGVVPSNASGTAVTSFPLGSGLAAGDVKRYQYWYRNPTGSPCGAAFNLTNGYELSWTN
jgi:FG-GAP repeat